MRVTVKRLKLAPYQEAFLYNPHRFTIVEASTKAGKTAGCIQWAVEQWHDMSFPVGWETTWCAPVYEQANIAYKRIKRALPNSYDRNDSTRTIWTPRGDELRFKSADDVNNLYGPDARAVIFEEFTRARHLMDAFQALRSTLTATKGKMKLIGNFIGTANAGHQLAIAHKNDPEWTHFIVNAMDAVKAGIIEQSEVDQARNDLPRSKFMALYMCEGSAHPLQLIRADAIADLWTNEHVPEGKPAIVCDVARFGRDRTVIGYFSGKRLKHVEAHASTDMPWIAQRLDVLAKQYKVPRSRIVVDEGGVGGGVVDLLKGCIAFNGAAPAKKVQKDLNYANLRAQCYYRLADGINGNEYHIETDDHRDDIALELEVVRRMDDMAEGKLKVIKKDEMKELIGKSPDFADLLMMHGVLDLSPSTDTFDRAIDHKLKTIDRENRDRWIENEFGHLKP